MDFCAFVLQKLSHFKVHTPIKSHGTNQCLAKATTKMIELSSKGGSITNTNPCFWYIIQTQKFSKINTNCYLVFHTHMLYDESYGNNKVIGQILTEKYFMGYFDWNMDILYVSSTLTRLTKL